MSSLISDLKATIKGDVINDPKKLRHYSADASVFRIMPEVVVAPKSVADIKALVNYVREENARRGKGGKKLSLTARSGGTDMGGATLTESIVVDMNKYLNKFVRFGGTKKQATVTVQPGMFYHDLEPKMNKRKLVYPSYPASKSIATLGGMVSNNSGGEMTLRYGQTVKFVEQVKAVLYDGNEYTIGRLTESQLAKKLKLKTFEGDVYRKMLKLLKVNDARIKDAKPKTSKNSTGYLLWDAYDADTGIINMAKVFTGAQGTLGILTEVTVQLVPTEKYEEMIVIYLDEEHQRNVADIINEILKLNPTALESYDDKTLKLALKYAPMIARMISKDDNIIQFGWRMIPDFLLMLRTHGLPKLVLMAEFSGNDRKALDKTIDKLTGALEPYDLPMRVAGSKEKAKKYWTIRRKSFSLLREKIKGKQTVPFIEDFIINPEHMPQFMPKLEDILDDYPQLVYTIAGHAGNGNFHIIPLMDLSDKKLHRVIPEISDRVYDLVIEYGGSISAEHNDGMIRGPYLRKMYGSEMIKIFKQTKKIFDPTNIFNPHKKTDATLKYSMKWVKSDNEHDV